MVSEKKMRDILRSVRAIGPNNAGVEQAAHLIAEAMKEGVVWEEAGICHAEGSDEYTRTYHLETVTGKLTIYQFADGLSPGKSYRVTVTKVD